jgi:D-alanine-D-alanine ligase
MRLPFIAILRGGYTGESVISMQSARTMLEAIDPARYAPVYVTVAQDTWRCERADGTTLPFDRGAFRADRGHGMERFDAALIAIHGTPGEDGRLQGYLDMVGVPYQTGGVLCMAVTMSKYTTTAMLRQLGFPVANSLLLPTSDSAAPANILQAVGLPCFVKPDGSGSSLGISKVERAEELPEALERAFAEGGPVMCEAMVSGRELTCGVIRLNGEVIALPVCEIRTDRPFFDYEAKYHSSSTEELVPAPIPDHVAHIIQERSKAIYLALRCDGMVRVDHFWKGGDTATDVVTIEVNTTPGFSPASIFPKMLNAAGIGVPPAVNALVAGLLQR